MRAPNGARGERSSDGEGRRAGAVALSRAGGKGAEIRRGADGVAGGVEASRHGRGVGRVERSSPQRQTGTAGIGRRNDCRGRAARARPCRRHGRRNPQRPQRSPSGRRRSPTCRSRPKPARPSPAGRAWRSTGRRAKARRRRRSGPTVTTRRLRRGRRLLSCDDFRRARPTRTPSDTVTGSRTAGAGAIAGPAARAPKQSFIESDLCASRPVA